MRQRGDHETTDEQGGAESTSTRCRPLLGRWYLRMPLKWLIFAAVTLVVLFPHPRRLVRHIEHLSDLEAMVDPGVDQLAAWEAEVLERLASRDRRRSIGADDGRPGENGLGPRRPSPDAPERADGRPPYPPRVVQRAVQRLVYEKVAYDWDWNVWGMADYMPTVREMFARAEASPDGRLREDCDGRAVMAASLMRRLNFDSTIVTDLRHVWVTTPQGDWMGPGRKKSMVSTPSGNRLDAATLLANVPVSLSFGISVFPWWRELLILAAAYGLMLHRRMSWRAAVAGGVLLAVGLFCMRAGVLSPGEVSTDKTAWPAVLGMLLIPVGFGVLWTASSRARRADRREALR